VVEGKVVSDITSISADSEAWSKLSDTLAYDERGNVVPIGTSGGIETPLTDTLVTDESGVIVFENLPFGYYKVVESLNNVNYQSRSQAGSNPAEYIVIDKDTTPLSLIFEDWALEQVDVSKVDADTNAPLDQTSFGIYVYPVEVVDGKVITDVSSIAIDSGDWLRVSEAYAYDQRGNVVEAGSSGSTETPLTDILTTNAQGVLSFGSLPFGYYKVVELVPNPSYATVEESGGTAQCFILDAYSTDQLQVFENLAIQISCEVYKKTIALTSSALDGTEHGVDNNVGQEEYLYHFGGRSTANVRADEFVITDDLSYVDSLGYRMTTLWTGTSPAGFDNDGLMAILYKTNLTSPDEAVNFSYHPLQGNPYNANNKDLTMVYSAQSGWKIWAEQLSTTEASRHDVASLNLASGEYITGLKVVYGGVEAGFYAGNGWQTSDDPHTVKTLKVSGESNTATTAADVFDFYYSVVATQALVPIDEAGNETVIRGSVTSDIARNAGALRDADYDEVQTRVIGSFSTEFSEAGEAVADSSGYGFPQTGDPRFWLIVLSGLIALGAVALTVVYFRRKKKRGKNKL
jgi:hypothetical protein